MKIDRKKIIESLRKNIREEQTVWDDPFSSADESIRFWLGDYQDSFWNGTIGDINGGDIQNDVSNEQPLE